MKNSWVSIFYNTRKNFKSNLILVVVLTRILRSQGDNGHNNSANIGIATGDNNGDNNVCNSNNDNVDNDNNSSDTNIGEMLKWIYTYKRLQIGNLSY